MTDDFVEATEEDAAEARVIDRQTFKRMQSQVMAQYSLAERDTMMDHAKHHARQMTRVANHIGPLVIGEITEDLLLDNPQEEGDVVRTDEPYGSLVIALPLLPVEEANRVLAAMSRELAKVLPGHEITERMPTREEILEAQRLRNMGNGKRAEA